MRIFALIGYLDAFYLISLTRTCFSVLVVLLRSLCSRLASERYILKIKFSYKQICWTASTLNEAITAGLTEGVKHLCKPHVVCALVDRCTVSINRFETLMILCAFVECPIRAGLKNRWTLEKTRSVSSCIVHLLWLDSSCIIHLYKNSAIKHRLNAKITVLC